MMNPELKLIKPGEVRTRFAPSPTGFLHIGSARTSLFNFIFARKHQGRFILRIEDTDKNRSTPEMEQSIIQGLKWLGIQWDEGPDIGGNYGPYRQSERKDIYQKYTEKLLEEKKAYYCFCSKEDLEVQRQYLMSIGKPPLYNGKCAELDEKTVQENLANKKEYIIRFKTPHKKLIFKDLIRGEIEFDTGLIGDFSIAKDLDSPLYNLACVIDDFEMKISHVIRGEEHISNTPKQILIHEALNLPVPQYAHLPMVLAPDKSKLSKRHGAIGLEDLKKAGYLPEAIVNFTAFLGWNPGTEREIYSMSSLIKEFSLERIKKSGAVFNIKRLDYLNSFYIRQKSIDELTNECIPYLIQAGLITEQTKQDPSSLEARIFRVQETNEEVSFAKLSQIVTIYQERLRKLSEIPELTDFFFKGELDYEKDLFRWKEQNDKNVVDSLNRVGETLSEIKEEDWNKNNLERFLIKEAEELAEEIDKKGDRGYLLWPFRVALTNKKASASPFEIAEILGRQKTLQRIEKAKQCILEQ